MEAFLQRAQADGGTECAQWRPLLHEAIEASCFPHRFFLDHTITNSQFSAHHVLLFLALL